MPSFFPSSEELRFHRETGSWLCGCDVAKVSFFLPLKRTKKKLKLLALLVPGYHIFVRMLAFQGLQCLWLCPPCHKLIEMVCPEKGMKYEMSHVFQFCAGTLLTGSSFYISQRWHQLAYLNVFCLASVAISFGLFQYDSFFKVTLGFCVITNIV